jgi:hypothetical protein
MKTLHFPLVTGQAIDLLHTTEARLAETVRRGLVQPPPPVLAGRRLWHRQHLLQAAQALDILTDDLRSTLEEEVPHGA